LEGVAGEALLHIPCAALMTQMRRWDQLFVAKLLVLQHDVEVVADSSFKALVGLVEMHEARRIQRSEP